MSTGKPVKTPSDMNRVKNEYLETLKLQSKLNNIVLQAVKTYKSSGQLPPSTQMTDTRTTTEILADTEKLKQGIVSDFSPLLEAQNALNFVNKLMVSNLNVDNKLLRFVAQSAPEIVGQLKKRYKYGIAGDENDIDTIIQFINKMFNDRANMFKSVKSYMNTTSLQGGTGRIIGANDTDAIIKNIEDIMVQLNNLYRGSPGYNLVQKKIYDLMPTLDFIKTTLPPSNELNNMMQNIGADFWESKEGEDLQIIFDILEKLPRVETINTYINLMKEAVKRKAKPEKVAEIMERLNNEFGELLDIKTHKMIEQYILNIKNYLPRKTMPPPEEIQPMSSSEPLMGQQYEPVSATPIQGALTPDQEAIIAQSEGEQQQEEQQPVVDEDFNTELDFLLTGLNLRETQNLVEYVSGIYPQYIFPVVKNANLTAVKNQLFQILSGMHEHNQYNIGDLNTSHMPGQTPIPQGFGIRQKKRVGRPRGCGISQVAKPPNFVGFGVNEINQKNLDKNILTIRRNTRTSFVDMPSKHISEKMKKIVKTIVGGGVPSFNDLSSLDEDEKDYLHKIISRSNLESRLSVPAPSKDQREKEIHQFEVMKGEIMSGNDSKELVKKFKLLIIKLSHQGMLPKTEVNAILEELVMLGY
jgi:hypothetical protein